MLCILTGGGDEEINVNRREERHKTRRSIERADCFTTLCLKKNDNDVLRYNFNAHQPILIFFGRYIAE